MYCGRKKKVNVLTGFRPINGVDKTFVNKGNCLDKACQWMHFCELTCVDFIFVFEIMVSEAAIYRFSMEDFLCKIFAQFTVKDLRWSPFLVSGRPSLLGSLKFFECVCLTLKSTFKIDVIQVGEEAVLRKLWICSYLLKKSLMGNFFVQWLVFNRNTVLKYFITSKTLVTVIF